MKAMIMALIFNTVSAVGVFSQIQKLKTDTVAVIPDFKNLYRYQNYFVGGQPTYETMLWLKSHGVNKIINLRTEKENTDFAGSAFNEETIARKAGFEYYSIPVDGSKDYTPEKLAAFGGVLNKKDSILIHCASGYRATDLFMAYLVKSRGYTINEAIEVGRKLKFSMPLEKLLDCKIIFDPEK